MKFRLLLCAVLCIVLSSCTSTTNQYVLFDSSPEFEDGYVRVRYINGENPAKVWVDDKYPVYVDGGAKLEYLQADTIPDFLYIQVADYTQAYSINVEVRTSTSSSYNSEESSLVEEEVDENVEIE